MDVFVIEQVIDLSGVNMPMIYRQALTQHDAYAHEWRVSVKKHGHAVDLTGCTAQIYFGPENKTGDGIVPGEALTQRAVAQGGAAYAQLLPELYQIDGRVMAIMRISDPEDHVMTAAVLRLHTSGVLEGDIGDPSGSVIELGALLAQLDELRTQTAAAREATAQSKTQQEAAEAAETARSAAESERVAAENYRVGHESTRQMHENDRVAHEKTRISSETTRRNAETERAAAETARSDAETARAEAEQQRAAAEEARYAAEADRVAAEQARAAAEQARQETFAGYEERIVAATPDDTTVDGRAWTSKKTVDSLCMPIEASGNPVQVYPVEGYPLGVKVSWEPTQAGSGDPSPDNIRPISGKDAVRVTRCGKNLFSTKNAIESSTANITNATIEDNRIVLSSTDGVKWLAYRATFDIPAGTYTVSLQATCSDEAYTPVFSIYFKNKDTGVNSAIGSINGIGAKTIEVPDGKFVSFYAHLSTDASYTGERTVEYSNIQLELGSTATPYEPYTGSTTDISLPETVYGGTLDVETGVVTVDYELISFNGSEDWFYNSGYNLFATNGGKKYDASVEPIVNIYMSKNGVSNVPDKTAAVSGGVSGWLIAIRDDDYNRDARSFAQHLAELYDAGAPMEIVRKLRTPRTIQIDKNQIAALDGVNTVYTDAGALTVTGREDPRHTIVTLTNRIAALESAAAGV